MIARQVFVDTVLRCLGTPYRHQGRLVGVGMDCPGPLIHSARALQLVSESFDVQGYAQEPDGSLQPLLDRHMQRVPRERLALGDVVLNAFRLQPPRHIAIVVGERHGEWEMLHACAIRGKVIVERIQYGRYYRFVQGYAVPGVQ